MRILWLTILLIINPLSFGQEKNEEGIPASLRDRLQSVRAEMATVNPGNQQGIQDTGKRVLAVCEELQNAGFPRAAAFCVFEWSEVCQDRLNSPLESLKWNKVAGSYQDLLGDESLKTRILFNRGVVLASISRFEEAIAAYLEADAIYRRNEDELRMAGLARNIGVAYASLSRVKEATAAFQRAERLFEKLGVKSELAGAKLNLGAVLLATSQYKEALKAFEEAEPLLQNDGDTRGLASVANNRGNIYQELNRPRKALEEYKKAEMWSRGTMTPLFQAQLAINKGNALTSLLKFQEALSEFSTAEAYFTKNRDRYHLSKIAVNRALIFREKGELERALEYLDTASKYGLAGDRAGLAAIVLDRGAIHGELGRYEDAMRDFGEAIRLYRALGIQAKIGHIEMNRAAVFSALNREEEALRGFEESAKVFVQIGDMGALGRALHAKGTILIKLGRTEEASKILKKAEKVLTSIDDKQSLMRVVVSQARLMNASGDREGAARQLDRVEKHFQRIGNKKGLGAILAIKGLALQSQGRHKEALQWIAEAIEILGNFGEQDRIATLRFSQAYSLLGLELYQDAKKRIGESLDHLEQVLTEHVVAIGIESSQSMRARFGYITLGAARVALALEREGRSIEGKNLENPELAFRALQLIHGRSVLENFGSSGTDLSKLDLSESERRELEELKYRRRVALKKREKLLQSRPYPEKKIAEVAEEIGRIDLKQRQLNEIVRVMNPVQATTLSPKPVTLLELTKTLPEGVAVIEIAMQEDLAWAFMARQGRAQMLQLGDTAKIMAGVEKLEEQFDAQTKLINLDVVNELSEEILAPILTQLTIDKETHPETLLFSLKDNLARLPVEILFTEKPESKANGELPFLVRKFDVAYIPSASTYMAMRKRNEKEARIAADRTCDFLAVGMPLDVAAEAEEEGRDEREVTQADLDPLRLRSGVSRSVLFGSKTEVLQVARLFARPEEVKSLTELEERIDDQELSESATMRGVSGARFKVLLRGGANEPDFKSTPELGQARYIHFAGHAEADLASPTLSRLVFAQSPRLNRATQDDGFLYFRELASLDLHADMLVLSACSTNRGAFVPTEGVMGLAQGGLLAGAKSVMSTIWKVEDEGAQRLVLDFYKKLIASNSTRIHALAEAKREAIASGVPISVWAAYVLWDAETDR